MEPVCVLNLCPYTVSLKSRRVWKDNCVALWLWNSLSTPKCIQSCITLKCIKKQLIQNTFRTHHKKTHGWGNMLYVTIQKFFYGLLLDYGAWKLTKYVNMNLLYCPLKVLQRQGNFFTDHFSFKSKRWVRSEFLFHFQIFISRCIKLLITCHLWWQITKQILTDSRK